jgi:hypothetical protein
MRLSGKGLRFAESGRSAWSAYSALLTLRAELAMCSKRQVSATMRKGQG